MVKAKQKPENWGTLAKRLHVSRTAIHEWKKLDGAPTEPNFEAWKAFVAENGLGVAGNRVSSKREGLLSDAARLKNRLLELEVARKEGRTVERTDMDTLHHKVFTRQKAVLFAALESEYPGKAVGRTASELRVLGRQLAERICDIFAQDVEGWEWPQN
jgi:hypothetical protein